MHLKPPNVFINKKWWVEQVNVSHFYYKQSLLDRTIAGIFLQLPTFSEYLVILLDIRLGTEKIQGDFHRN